MFTQSRVEELIEERLGRERKHNETLLCVKDLLKKASDKGFISGTSYSQMANDLIEKLEDGSLELKKEEPGTEEVQEGTCETSNNEDGKADVSLNRDGECNECTDEKAEGQNDESFITVLKTIKQKYPMDTVEKLLSGDLFERFVKGRSGSILEIFDDYYDFTQHSKGLLDKDESDTAHLASTAFSSHSGAVHDGSNLTKQQMEMAKSAGLSYREYAHLLESVPKTRAKSF